LIHPEPAGAWQSPITLPRSLTSGHADSEHASLFQVSGNQETHLDHPLCARIHPT